MIVLKKRNKAMIRAAIDRISDSQVRRKMRMNAESMQRPNGADQIANWIIQNLPQ